MMSENILLHCPALQEEIEVKDLLFPNYSKSRGTILFGSKFYASIMNCVK